MFYTMFNITESQKLSHLFHGYEVMKILFCFNRYASLYFCCAVETGDNELLTLEVIHRYVELLDKYFGSVCIILNHHDFWRSLIPSYDESRLHLCLMVM